MTTTSLPLDPPNAYAPRDVALTSLRHFLRGIVFFIVGMSLAIAAPRVNTLEKKGFFGYEPNGIAIRGYDTVAYFTEGAPVKGSSEFSTEWKGAIWHFASQEHLDAFNDDQERYAPQFGGYCAYGVAQGNLVKIEPELWTIVEAKLYLNYDKDVQRQWEEDIPGFIGKANRQIDGLIAAQ